MLLDTLKYLVNPDDEMFMPESSNYNTRFRQKGGAPNTSAETGPDTNYGQPSQPMEGGAIAAPTTPDMNAQGTAAASGEADNEEFENKILEIVTNLEKEDANGAAYDKIIDQTTALKLNRNLVEETINNMLEKAVIYEPVLGKIKIV